MVDLVGAAGEVGGFAGGGGADGAVGGGEDEQPAGEDESDPRGEHEEHDGDAGEGQEPVRRAASVDGEGETPCSSGEPPGKRAGPVPGGCLVQATSARAAAMMTAPATASAAVTRCRRG